MRIISLALPSIRPLPTVFTTQDAPIHACKIRRLEVEISQNDWVMYISHPAFKLRNSARQASYQIDPMVWEKADKATLVLHIFKQLAKDFHLRFQDCKHGYDDDCFEHLSKMFIFE